MMNLSGWLKKKFLEWQVAQGETKTQAQFATYLGVPPTSLSNWINSGSKPRAEYVGQIADVLGFEIYDVLGITRPDIGTMTPRKRQVVTLLDEINDDQVTEQVIAELEAIYEKKRQK